MGNSRPSNYDIAFNGLSLFVRILLAAIFIFYGYLRANITGGNHLLYNIPYSTFSFSFHPVLFPIAQLALSLQFWVVDYCVLIAFVLRHSTFWEGI